MSATIGPGLATKKYAAILHSLISAYERVNVCVLSEKQNQAKIEQQASVHRKIPLTSNSQREEGVRDMQIVSIVIFFMPKHVFVHYTTKRANRQRASPRVASVSLFFSPTLINSV